MGGAERQIFELSKRLDKDKFDVTVVSLECEGSAPGEIIESAGCRLFLFRVKRIYGLSGFIQGLRFFRFLRDNEIDILQTYHFSSDIWGAFWARLAGVPVVISNRRDMGFWRKGHHVFAYRLVNRWVKRIVVVSEAVKKMVMATERIPGENMEVIYNGIELPAASRPQQTSYVSNGKDKEGITSEDIVIVHVANLRPVKGHKYLLKALAEIVREFPHVKLVLIGEGELKSSLQDLADTLGMREHVLFLGKRQDISPFLNRADICVMPSLSEGMSNAILEYMAAGKPVVATNAGGNPELIQNGYNGFLVEKENTEELKEALLTLLQEPEKRRLIGQNGFHFVRQHFSMSQMIAKYEKVFTDSVTRKTRVLHLVSSGGLYGAEKVILNLVRHTNDRLTPFVGALWNRHNPHLEVVEEARKAGLKTAVFDVGGRFDLGAIFRVKNFLGKQNVDIIHTHNYKSDIIGFFAARLAGKRWIVTNHVWHSTDTKLKFYERIDAFVLKFAHKVIAVSDEIKNELIEKKIKSGKVKVIHNGIDVPLYGTRVSVPQPKAVLGINDNDQVVTIVGRLSKEKGHAIFLAAAEKVLENRHNIRFLVVGDGPLKESLKADTANHNLTHKVIFTGIRQDMPEIYALSDILVNASFIEGLPMTILEAMAAKVAVIATRVGAVPQVIRHGINGILLDPGDPKTLSREICSLLEDANKRNRLASQAYTDVCKNFNATKMSDQYFKIYEEVLN